MKAIVIDIDGTITNRKRHLHLGVAARLRDLGIPVVLATGNPLCYAHAAAKLIGLCGVVIAENGGVVSFGFDTDPVVQDGMKDCEKAFELLSEKFTLNTLGAAYRSTEVVLSRDVPVETLRETLGSRVDVEIIDTGYAIHIKSRHINKGTGLTAVAAHLGLSEKDFVAIGDSCNDVEMMRLSEVGIAVANADEAAREAADRVMTMPFGEGVMEALDLL